jgi:Antibiotic biosynthesis monooxygenase
MGDRLEPHNVRILTVALLGDAGAGLSTPAPDPAKWERRFVEPPFFCSGSKRLLAEASPAVCSHLDKVPGFVEFHLLKGPEAEDHTLYASHTVWENRAVFEAWTPAS